MPLTANPISAGESVWRAWMEAGIESSHARRVPSPELSVLRGRQRSILAEGCYPCRSTRKMRGPSWRGSHSERSPIVKMTESDLPVV